MIYPDPEPKPEEYEYDNGPIFTNNETEILYDIDGEQHVVMNDNEECS